MSGPSENSRSGVWDPVSVFAQTANTSVFQHRTPGTVTPNAVDKDRKQPQSSVGRVLLPNESALSVQKILQFAELWGFRSCYKGLWTESKKAFGFPFLNLNGNQCHHRPRALKHVPGTECVLDY